MSSPVLCDEGGEVGRWGKTDPSSRGISRTWKMMEELMNGTMPREKMPSLEMLPPVRVST